MAERLFSLLSNIQLQAVAVMLSCYLILFSEKINRAVVTMLAAFIMLFLGVLTENEAIHSIDFNTVSLLVGMMVIVNITERSGLFQFVAIWGAQKVKANPVGIMFVLILVTAVFSAFLDNVTTVLLIVPVTFQIAEKLEIKAYPYLLAEIFASNIGGTATLIGDPPNILIGSALNLSFTDFLVNLTPVVLVCMTLLIAVFTALFKKDLKTTDRNRALVMRINAKSSIADKTLLVKSLSVLVCVIVGFISAEKIHLSNGIIALSGAMVLLLLYTLQDKLDTRDEKTETIFNLTDWTTIFFFCGLFVVVGGLEVTGILERVGRYLITLTQANIQKATFLVLGVSAAFSSAIDNIPFVATMIPTLKSIEESIGGREIMMPVWWALSLGACFGGNGTLIGASANVIVAGLALKHGEPIGFVKFLLYSMPVMLLSILIAGFYLYLRYFGI